MLGVWRNSKLQALVYDIIPSRKVPESDARSVLKGLGQYGWCGGQTEN